MSSKSNKATIRDVAQAAGVSISTVSRVLNHRDTVADVTAARVESIIHQLGFSSSLAARSMRRQKTNCIGVIIPDVRSHFSLTVLRGVGNALSAHGYDLITYSSGNRTQRLSRHQDQQSLALLDASVTDGVILVAPFSTSFHNSQPVVVIEPNTESPAYPAVLINNYLGAMLATRHLIELGHTSIGYLHGMIEFKSATDRFAGYKQALNEAGLEYDPMLVAPGAYEPQMSEAAAHQILSSPNRPTAVFAACDLSAAMVVSVAKAYGLHIPKDLSIVGFDNTIEAQLCVPALTTVDQFVELQGFIAGAILLNQLGVVEYRNIPTLPTPTLVVRESTAPPQPVSKSAQTHTSVH